MVEKSKYINTDENRRSIVHYGERGCFKSAPIQPESERFSLNRGLDSRFKMPGKVFGGILNLESVPRLIQPESERFSLSRGRFKAPPLPRTTTSIEA